MADKITRERAMYQGNIVTVLKRKRGSVEIRNQYGYVMTVKSKELSDLGDDAKAAFTFEDVD